MTDPRFPGVAVSLFVALLIAMSGFGPALGQDGTPGSPEKLIWAYKTPQIIRVTGGLNVAKCRPPDKGLISAYVILAWQPLPGRDGVMPRYVVLRRTRDLPFEERQCETSAYQDNMVLDRLPDSEGLYTYVIEASFPDDPSRWRTEERTVEFIRPVPPPPPRGLKAQRTKNGVTVSWEPVQRAIVYMVYRKVDQGEFRLIAQTETPEYQDTGPDPGELWYAVSILDEFFVESRLSEPTAHPVHWEPPRVHPGQELWDPKVHDVTLDEIAASIRANLRSEREADEKTRSFTPSRSHTRNIDSCFCHENANWVRRFERGEIDRLDRGIRRVDGPLPLWFVEWQTKMQESAASPGQKQCLICHDGSRASAVPAEHIKVRISALVEASGHGSGTALQDLVARNDLKRAAADQVSCTVCHGIHPKYEEVMTPYLLRPTVAAALGLIKH